MIEKIKQFIRNKMATPNISGSKTVYFERSTVDEDYFAGGVFGTVIAPEEDSDWKLQSINDADIAKKSASEILDILADASPDLSRALYDMHQNIVTEWTWTTNENDEAGNKILQNAAYQMEHQLGESIGVKIGKLVDAAFLKGALYAENIFHNEEFVDIVILDPFNVRFRRAENEERGQYWQIGQDRGSDGFEPLNSTYVRYVPLIPRTEKPYGRPIAASAIYPIVFLLGMMKAVRQSIHIQAFPNRVYKINRKHLADAKYTPEQINKIIDDLRPRIIDQAKRSHLGTQFIEGGEFEAEIIGGINNMSYQGVEMLENILERMIIRGLKQFPINFAITEGSALSSGNADQQLEQFSNAIDSFMRRIENLFSIYGTQILNNYDRASTATFQLKRNHSITERIRADRMSAKMDVIIKANGGKPIITPIEGREIFKQPDGLERLNEILMDNTEYERMLEDSMAIEQNNQQDNNEVEDNE